MATKHDSEREDILRVLGNALASVLRVGLAGLTPEALRVIEKGMASGELKIRFTVDVHPMSVTISLLKSDGSDAPDNLFEIHEATAPLDTGSVN